MNGEIQALRQGGHNVGEKDRKGGGGVALGDRTGLCGSWRPMSARWDM